MSPLPHYSQLKAAQNKEEPIYLNLFEVRFQLPSSINGGETLHQSAKAVGLPTHPELETVQQRYKFSTRTYVSFPTETTVQFDVVFNVNVDDNNSPYNFKSIVDLYKLAYNPATGETARKQDTVSTITVDVHNKIGEIIRRVVYKDAQIMNISDMELDWENGEPFEFTATFTCDNWDDLIIGD